jgi:hypothetical protein
MSKEVHQLAQGKPGVTNGTNTIFFLSPKKVQYIPTDWTVGYGQIVINHRPQKEDPNCICITVGGSFLYYAWAVNLTILMASSDIATQQATPTENTKKRVDQFLDYMWTHPDAKIHYRASDMILNVHSNASYLSAPCARSHASDYFFLGSLPIDSNPIKLNGAIHITCTILKLIAVSAAGAKLGALFLNAQEATVLRLTLDELEYP